MFILDPKLKNFGSRFVAPINITIATETHLPMAAVVTSTSPAAYPRIMSPSVPQATLREPPSRMTLHHSSKFKEERAPEEEEDHNIYAIAASPVPVAEEPTGVRQVAETTTRENSKPSCCRKIIHQFEKEHTFRPKLNPSSLKIVGQRQHQPLLSRLSEAKRAQGNNAHSYFDENLTFSPKLNSLSIKLAQERAGKLHEVQSKASALAAIRIAEIHSEYTFKPAVLGRSIRIAEKLDMGFLGRQQQHIARKQQLAAQEYILPPQKPPPYKLTPRLKPNNANQITLSTPPVVKSQQFSHKLSRRRHRSQTAPCLPVSELKPNKPVLLLRQESDRGKKLLKSPKNKSVEESPGLLQKNFKQLNEGDRVKRIKVQAEKAIRAKKVFQIKGGYQTIRKALRSRGWVENCYHCDYKTNIPPSKKPTIVSPGSNDDDDDVYDSSDDCDSSDSESEDEKEDDEEYMMLCRAVRNCEPHFIWSLRRVDVHHQYLKKDQMVNHFSGAMFTTKFGLCENLHDLPWYGDVDADTFFPRCYQLNNDEDKRAFKEDYQLTAAFNVLKIIACENNPLLYSHYGSVSMVDERPRVIISSSNESVKPSSTSETLTTSSSSASISAPATPCDKRTQDGDRNCMSSSPKKRLSPVVPEELLLLSIRETESFLSRLDHEDIEGSKTQLESSKLTQEEWCQLLAYYYSLIFCNGVLFCSKSDAIRAEELLLQLKKHYPQLSIDGSRNIWIIKPGAMSRGRGIICKDHLHDILDFVSPSILMKKNMWVVQKYIERPLLIYATKFDIRQWFLVTDWNPLTMWMYKDCYLRFSTQLYSLQKLDTSIHLCNNSVQKHLTNSEERSENLPQDNMWDSNTFQSYLKSIGEGDKWRKVIYPGMKQAIISVLQVSQDRVIDRKNTFELYGADFMICANYKPWLIEINSSPTMEKSTAVTKKLCKQVMEDTIKVVIDRKNNRDCDIGAFELAYKQAKLDVPPYIGLQLTVEGSAIKGVPASRSWRGRQTATTVPIIFGQQ
ncbi:PREDICTED: tubulin monoglycylase TTLL3-like [Amphimedon queenslandica]|uniref:Uncharacterized protein n=1 Tax=Amphimedon queenslandica TaxID=400682 RepID=A0A1X7VJ14_AMPQE|nr:PREDICTED: tubulin monoglycylase TTLL3-like [Amphimedon queenslandica]|eukprot:XP_003383995.2 PREDICTED: tubulin monoglycylase TTLL3-like [Amphimedon queenslandica]